MISLKALIGLLNESELEIYVISIHVTLVRIDS